MRIHELPLIAALLIAPPAFSQEDPNQPMTAGKSGYLNLTIGVHQDEKMLELPGEIELKGTFRKFTSVQWNPKTHTMRFIPKSQGVGTLVIKDPETQALLAEYHIDVRKTDLQKVAREIQYLLRSVEGLQIKILNNKVVVDGEVLVTADMKRIHSVVKLYGGQAVTLVTVNPNATTKVARIIEREIGNPEIRVTAVNGRFILAGFANTREERDKAEIITKMYVPDVVVDEAEADKVVLARKIDAVVNLIAVRPPPEGEPNKIVQLVVHYIELSKDHSKSFRFQWMPDIDDGSGLVFKTGEPSSTGGLTTSVAGTLKDLLPKLNWAKEYGFARVLQSSTLTVEDGHPGIINSTARLPYQVVNAQGQPSTNFEDTGIRTTITPKIMGPRSDSVELTINFAVKSLLSYSNQGPLTAGREMQTVLHVRSGQSAPVGGLVTNDSGTNYDKLPANVSANPLLSLYSSMDSRHNQNQFVVFVNPVIKSSASGGSEKIKKKFKMN